MSLGVCPGHIPSQAQRYGCTTLWHAQASLEKGQRQEHGESCCNLCEVPRDEVTGMQPAGPEGEQMTKRYFQEKQGEEELTVLDASNVEDSVGRCYF